MAWILKVQFCNPHSHPSVCNRVANGHGRLDVSIQLEVSIIQSFNCNRKILSPLIALGGGVAFAKFYLSSHTNGLACVRQQKTEVLKEKTQYVTLQRVKSQVVYYLSALFKGCGL